MDLFSQIYIGDLGNDATRYELEDAFTPFGTVKNVWIAKRPPGKQEFLHIFANVNILWHCLPGFAFILMDDPRDAEDAVKELDGTRMCGRRVKVLFLSIIIIFNYFSHCDNVTRNKRNMKITLDHVLGMLITSLKST